MPGGGAAYDGAVRLPRPTLALGALVCAGALVLAVPAGAGNAPSLKLAKKLSGPYQEELNTNVSEGQTRTRYLRVRSTEAQKRAAILREERAGVVGANIVTKWFKGKKSITQDVHGDGYAFSLKAGAVKRFKIKVKLPEGVGEACILPSVESPAGFFGSAILWVNDPDCFD